MEVLLVILSIIIMIVLFVGGVLLYFLPAFIAHKRGHANKNAILVLNFLLGWTFLGWAGCLVWAYIDTDGSAANKALRNVGGNKYEDLERLQKLKDAGTITDTEFEAEKAKLLK